MPWEYACAGKGIWKYDGTAWTDISGVLSDYYCSQLVYDDTHKLLYTGMVDHGVWKYDGTSWVNIGGTDHSASALVYDSTHELLYAGDHGVDVYGNFTRIDSVTPSAAKQGESLNVSVAGNETNFVQGQSAAAFLGTGITANSTTVTDSTHATANITIAAGAPTGNMVFYDFANMLFPTAIQSTSYSALTIPDGQKYAVFSGTCTFRGQAGYDFTLVAEDLGSCYFWMFNNQDKIHLSVKNTATGTVVYTNQSVVYLGEIAIKR